MTSPEAISVVSTWLERATVIVPEPTDRHWPILKGLIAAAQIGGAGVSDAHLAALAIEHGATLCTTDRDFARFPGLSMRNPLEA